MKPTRLRFLQCPHNGFTLVEVVVSLAILAIAGLVLASSFTGFLHNYDAAYKRAAGSGDVALVRAAILAEADLEKAAGWNDLALPEGGKARWRVAASPTLIADLFNAECEIEITDKEAAAPAVVRLKLTLLRPTWSQPDERESLRAASADRLAERQFE